MQPKAFRHIVTAGCLLLAILHVDAYATIYKHTDTHQHSNTDPGSIEAIISAVDSLNSLRQFQKAIDTLNHFTEHNPLDSLSLYFVDILKHYSDAYLGMDNQTTAISTLKLKHSILEQMPDQQKRQADVLLRSISTMTPDESFDSYIPLAIKAIQIYRELEDNSGLAKTYLRVGSYLETKRKDNLGIFFGELAKDCLMQDENPDVRDRMMIDNTLGSFYVTLDIDIALDYYDKYYNASLQLEEDSIARGWSAGRYGWVLMHGKRYDESLKLLRKGQMLLEPILGSESASLGHFYLTLGELYIHLGMLDSAQLYLDRTFSIYNNIDPNYRWIDAVHRMYASLYQAKDEYINAIESQIRSYNLRGGIIQDSINANDTLDIQNFPCNEVGRFTLYMNRRYFRKLYEQTAEIKNLEMSLIYSSQLTNFMLNVFYGDLASEAHLNSVHHRSITSNLATSFQDLNNYQGQAKYNKYLMRFYNDISVVKAYFLQSRVNQGHIIRSAEAETLFIATSELQREIDELESRTIMLNSDISSSDDDIHRLAKLYLLHYMSTREFEKAQQKVDIQRPTETGIDKLISSLPDETLLIDYFIADSVLAIFSVSSSGIDLTVTDIDSTFFQLLTNHNRALRTASSQFETYNQKLSEYLLKPVYNTLEGRRHIIVIPHGELFNIPFEALALPNDDILLSNHSVTYHYSSNLLTQTESPAQPSYVAFAPGFVDETNAMLEHSIAVRADTSFYSNQIQYRNGNYLMPIPYAIEEVNEILKLTGDRFRNPQVFKGAKASKANFIASIADADIVHIATHGHTSISSPGLTGLFFAQNTGTDNGYLYLHELYTITIDAHLVVLSACDTGRGMLLDSEGAFALPRGFITAGVPNVIASLWKVHDERTKELMVAFYRHMLDGNSYTQSLRLAKLDCISNGFLPLDWAGFVLIGG